MSREYGFHDLNASRSVRSVAADLRRAVTKLIDEPAASEEKVSAIQPLREKTAGPAKTSANVVDLNKKVLP
jgi:hypothetical protein